MTTTLEEIYRDPAILDQAISRREPLEIVAGGEVTATLLPEADKTRRARALVQLADWALSAQVAADGGFIGARNPRGDRVSTDDGVRHARFRQSGSGAQQTAADFFHRLAHARPGDWMKSGDHTESTTRSCLIGDAWSRLCLRGRFAAKRRQRRCSIQPIFKQEAGQLLKSTVLRVRGAASGVQSHGHMAHFHEVALCEHLRDRWPVAAQQTEQFVVGDIACRDEEQLWRCSVEKKAIHKISIFADHNATLLHGHSPDFFVGRAIGSGQVERVNCIRAKRR